MTNAQGHIQAFLAVLDEFIAAQIVPPQNKDDNYRFFDHRRENARTQWTNQGLSTVEWEALLYEARGLADRAGFYRFAYPIEYGGAGNPRQNLFMCAIRHHLARNYGRGLGLANDLQSEHSVVANDLVMIMLHHSGTADQRKKLIPAAICGELRATFGLIEPDHGSDATYLETAAKQVLAVDGTTKYEITGRKKWQTGRHRATHFIVFARTSGLPGNATGITAFIVPRTTPGVEIDSYE